MKHVLAVALLGLVALAACAAMPDEVAVTTFTNEYDYLGGDDLKGLGSQNGNSTGVALTATYKLKPQQVQIVQAAAVPKPLGSFEDAAWNKAQDALPKLDDLAKQLLEQPVTQAPVAEKALSIGEDLLTFVEWEKVWIVASAAAMVCLWWLIRRNP